MPKQKQLDDKFYGNKPLKIFTGEKYPDICLLKHNRRITWIVNEIKFLINTMLGKSLSREGKEEIVFATKAPEAKFTQYDFLHYIDGPGFIVHQRVVNKFNEMCPNDFQAFSIVIKNLNQKGEYFENKDYYLINTLYLVNAIDLERTKIDDSNGIAWVRGYTYFKEDCMDDHLIAREATEGYVIFHPNLAREFVRCKAVEFLSEREIWYS